MNNSSNELKAEIDYIQSLEEKKEADRADFDKLSLLSQSKNSEVRLAVSEILVNLYNDDSEQILMKMLGDTDSLVLASVCDSLCCSSSIVVLHRLYDMSRNKSYLVRGYSALSIGDIQLNIGDKCEETVIFLRTWLKRENSVWVKTAVARSLFILGKYEYLPILLKSINNGSYKIRYMALNCLLEFLELPISLNENARIQVISVLKERLKIEKIQYAKEKIQQTIKLYEKSDVELL